MICTSIPLRSLNHSFRTFSRPLQSVFSVLLLFSLLEKLPVMAKADITPVQYYFTCCTRSPNNMYRTQECVIRIQYANFTTRIGQRNGYLTLRRCNRYAQSPSGRGDTAVGICRASNAAARQSYWIGWCRQLGITTTQASSPAWEKATRRCIRQSQGATICTTTSERTAVTY